METMHLVHFTNINHWQHCRLELQVLENALLIVQLQFQTLPLYRYPLFIRLEIHLNIEWQMVVVNLLNEVFGNKLYRPRNDPFDWVHGKRRPTPNDFQMRIILVVRFSTIKVSPGQQDRLSFQCRALDVAEM